MGFNSGFKGLIMQLDMLLIVILPRVACKPAHNNGRGPLPYKCWAPMAYTMSASGFISSQCSFILQK